MIPAVVQRVTGGDVFVFVGVILASLGMIPAAHIVADLWHRLRRK